ncbi:hypothetical protein HJC23_004124 [Cyclotella cryptica]|uniref:Uncharacterized protein n=1 Tax=Cyclotella cryptica TaxID=29204 RepID=A0ABD3P926_9STRA|eukprot:CCRYP_016576-RA/>CCRYP_016576-RA protein AED:0.00 eAED:0.00 QI:50/0/0.5/1/0/0.5/2/717/156
MNTQSPTVIYSETFRPWFLPLTFFLPCFWNYGVLIEKDDENEATLTFGYGIFGPTTGALCSHTTPLRDIDKSSVVTGYSSGKDNLFQFGGWGIRRSFRNSIWAYNASFRGPFCEFDERRGGRSITYRIATENPDSVASLLRGESSGIVEQEAKKFA